MAMTLHCPSCGKPLKFNRGPCDSEGADCEDCKIEITFVETDDQTGEYSLTVSSMSDDDSDLDDDDLDEEDEEDDEE